MARHILGALGVLAALVLLVVSMVMNYQFGYNLGKTHADGQIYGMASAAADCFKALTPFFFFAALRNRVWSQAAAAAMVWLVVTVYAFTSALGHAANNRFEMSGQRVAATTNYKETKAERDRVEEQLKWVPPHRPASTVAAELNVLKAQRAWMTSKECTDPTIKASREFCQQYFKLSAEHSSGLETEKLHAKLAELGAQAAKAGKVGGAAVLGLADPQANLIARLTGLDFETVQTGLMLFVALLIEIGSGFGMYVAFAYWRPNQNLHDIGEEKPRNKTVEVQPARREEKPEPKGEKKDEAPPTGKADPIWTAEPVTASAEADGKGAAPPAVRPFGDNDNLSARPAVMPPSDVERFYQEYVDSAGENAWVASMTLNEAYKLWCRRNDRRILAMPAFTAEFDKLKVVKHDIAGGVKYFGIAIKPDIERELDRKSSRKKKGALGEIAASQSKPTDDQLAAAAGELQATADKMRAAIDKPETPPGESKAA